MSKAASIKLDVADLGREIELLPSQKAFVYAPEMFSCISAGFASGKTYAGCIKGLLLSSIFPNNRGMIARYHSTDLEISTKQVFFELCPPSWIKSNKGPTNGNYVTLRNGSIVYFRHIHDASAKNAGKTRIHGMNLGWAFIDQMEELELEHFNSVSARIRYTGVPKRFLFGAINPKGHDWNWKMFFPTFREEWKKDEFFQVIRARENYLGVAVNSEENRVSNGGFVDDSYFDALVSQYDDDWRERYVHGSFRDFTGRIFGTYNSGIDDPDSSSVHNIRPFDIPLHWQLIVGIDVGGDSPWAIVPEYIDDCGNTVVAKGLVKNKISTFDVANWIKANIPRWQQARFVVDWENKVVMQELAEYGIHCQPANKAMLAGVMRQKSYFKVYENVPLPSWYLSTQPQDRVAKFMRRGSPRTFVFDTFEEYRKDFGEAVWDEMKKDRVKKTGTRRFDCVDADRYVKMVAPQPSQYRPDPSAKYAELALRDPVSAREAMIVEQKIDEINYNRRSTSLRESNVDEIQDMDGPQFVKGGWEYDSY